MDIGVKGYSRQISIFLSEGEFQKAYDAAKELVSAHPNEFLAHYFMAVSANSLGKYEEGKSEGKKAYILSSSPQDMSESAKQVGVANFQLGEYSEGISLLKQIKPPDEQIEQLLLALSLCAKDVREASKHLETIYAMNKMLAMDIARKFSQKKPIRKA